MKIDKELLDIDGIKSSNKSLLELFIRRTAVITSTPESLVEKIIKDQWSNANKVAQGANNIAQIDFYNLGMFYLSKTKGNRKLKKIQEIEEYFDNAEQPIEQNLIERRKRLRASNQKISNSIRSKLRLNQLEENKENET